MDQQQNSKKRRLIDQNTKIFTPMMVDQATMTDCQKPMHLNVWTQTDFDPKASAVEFDLRDRILKLEEKLRTHALLLSQLTSRNSECKDDLHSSSSFNYKIVSEGTNIQLEPIVVECATEEDVIYFEETPICENNHDIIITAHNQNQKDNSIDPRTEIYSNYNSRNQSMSPRQKCIAWKEETNSSVECTDGNIISHEINGLTQQSATFSTSGRITRSSSSHQHNQNHDITESLDISNSSNNSCNRSINNYTSSTLNKHSNSSMNIYTPDSCQEATTSNTKSVECNSSNNNTSHQSSEIPHNEQNYIAIGPNNTRVPLHIFQKIDWNAHPSATRKLLTALFDRTTLATHSLSGKPSPAFHDRKRPSKKQLDPKIITDIIYVVSRKCKVAEREVRNSITTKCADENKMLRQRQLKQKSEFNKENIVKNEMII